MTVFHTNYFIAVRSRSIAFFALRVITWKTWKEKKVKSDAAMPTDREEREIPLFRIKKVRRKREIVYSTEDNV